MRMFFRERTRNNGGHGRVHDVTFSIWPAVDRERVFRFVARVDNHFERT